MPGIGDEIEGAMQQAPHPARHSMKPFNHGERGLARMKCLQFFYRSNLLQPSFVPSWIALPSGFLLGSLLDPY
jgi:hypothetical protein